MIKDIVLTHEMSMRFNEVNLDKEAVNITLSRTLSHADNLFNSIIRTERALWNEIMETYPHLEGKKCSAKWDIKERRCVVYIEEDSE